MPIEHFEKGPDVIPQKVFDDVRRTLIESLEESLLLQTKSGTVPWVNEANCRELIERLRSKTPTKIGGPYWGEHVGAAIEKNGYPDYGTTRDQHFQIWKKIEDGE